MTASHIFRKVRTWAQSTQAVKDDAGVALVAIVFILGSAALVGTTAVLMREQGIQAELRQVKGQRANYDRIQDALEVFALQDFNAAGTAGAGGNEFKLPCPADPTAGTGVRDAWSGTACTDQRGIVPWASIGLAESDVVDEQGNYITYIVPSGTLEACDGTTPRTASTLQEQLSSTFYNYTLIGHGENGFGAFSQATNAQLTNPSSAQEQANCQADCDAGAGTGFTASQFRSGPASDDSTNFFDDIVRPVLLSENFTKECETLFEVDEETATTVSLTVDQLQDNFTRTGNSSSEQTRNVDLTVSDNGTEENYTDDTAVLRFNNSSTIFASASCAWFQPPIPMQGNVVRMLAEFGARTDTGDTRGNGVVFAVMSYDPDAPDTDAALPDIDLEDGSGYVLSTTICGGTDSFMGFADEQIEAVDRYLPSVPRFGIEIDTESHQGTAGEPEVGGTDNVNQDASTNEAGDAWNHIAIIGSNNDHEGNEQIDTGDARTDDPVMGEFNPGTNRGDGPACIVSLNGSHGTNNLGQGTTADDLGGCYPGLNPDDIDDPNSPGSPITVGMLETGDDTPETDGDFHQLRMDMTYGGGSCASDEVFVQYWLWLADGAVQPTCESEALDCSDLTQDYADGNNEDASKSACVPWGSDFNDAFMRFGFTTGAPAVNAAGRDELTVRRLDLLSIATTPATAGTQAVGTQSVEVHNVNVVDDVVGVVYADDTTFNAVNEDSVMGLIDMNAGTEAVFDTPRELGGVRLIGRNGTFAVQMDSQGVATDLIDDDGIGMKGIGNDEANEFDMQFTAIDDMGTPGTGDDEGVYVNSDTPEDREAIEIQFYHDDDSEPSGTPTRTSYERISLNLGRFAQTTETSEFTPDDPPEKQVIIRAFSGSSLVREDTIASCNETTNNQRHMFLSLDYSTPVDRLILIPEFLGDGSEPSQYLNDTYGSSFYVRGIKGCDDTRSCGLLADATCVRYGISESSPGGHDVSNLENIYPYGGLGNATVFEFPEVTGVITLANLNEHFNSIYTSDLIPTDVTSGSDSQWRNFEGDLDVAYTAPSMDPFIYSDDGPVYVDVIPTGGDVRLNGSANDYENGFSIEGGGVGGDTEEIEFLWHTNWDTVLITLGGFGHQNDVRNANRLEKVRITGYNDGGMTDVGSVDVTSCADPAYVSTNPGTITSDQEVMVNIIVDFDESTDMVNRLVLEPIDNDNGNTSDFYVHAIRMCSEGNCGLADSRSFGSLNDVGDGLGGAAPAEVVDCEIAIATTAN